MFNQMLKTFEASKNGSGSSAASSLPDAAPQSGSASSLASRSIDQSESAEVPPSSARKRKCRSNDTHPDGTAQQRRFSFPVAATGTGDSPTPLHEDSIPPDMLGLRLRKTKSGALPTNPRAYFNFAVDVCWRANAPVLSPQIERMFSAHQDEAGVARTEGHGSWFHDNVDWLISAWVAARVQISRDHTMQRRTLTKFWGNRDTKEHVLGLLNEWLKTLFSHSEAEAAAAATDDRRGGAVPGDPEWSLQDTF